MALAAGLVAAATSGAFSVALLGRYAASPGRSGRALLAWGLALAMFCVASLMLLVGVVVGWGSATFRAFYLFGAVLNVPWLALGSVEINLRSAGTTKATGAFVLLTGLLFLPAALGGSWLAIPGAVLGILWGVLLSTADAEGIRAGARALLGIFTVIGAFAVLSAVFEQPLPSEGLPAGRDLFPELVRGLAVGGNAVGSVIVVIGAIASAVTMTWTSADERVHAAFRRQVRRAPLQALAEFILAGVRAARAAGLSHLASGNLLIALGVLLAAGSGGMFSFLGEMAGHAVGLGLGVVVMFFGFRRTTERPVTIEVYTRDNCGLCRQAEELVAREARRADVRRIDVDQDDDLQRRYNVRVPVIVVQGDEVAEGRVEPGVVKQAVRRARTRR